MNNYLKDLRLLKIPFQSKSFLYELMDRKKYRKGKWKYEGIGYYLIDKENNVVFERPQLISASRYRMNDEKMKLTFFWKKWGEIRSEILDDCIDSESKSSMTEKQIEDINKVSIKKFKTILTLNQFVKGSNTTGAESNPKASEILISFSKDNEFSGYRFVNAIKKISCKKNYGFLNNLINTFDDFKKFKEIEFVDFLESNKIFKTNFNFINDLLFDINYEQYKNSEIKNSREIILMQYLNNLITKDKMIERLRRVFRTSLLFNEIKNNPKINKTKILDLEAAHIFNVEWITKLNDDSKYLWIADGNNGLLLEPTIHRLLDKNRFTYNLDGSIKILSEAYLDKKIKSINKNLIVKERVFFLKKRNRKLEDMNLL